MLRPHAERTLAAAEEAVESVKEVRTLTGGTASFGTFGSAHHYLLGGLVQDFRRRHPDVRVRVVGQNSAEVADAVRDGAARGRADRAADRRPRARGAARRSARRTTTSARARSAWPRRRRSRRSPPRR